MRPLGIALWFHNGTGKVLCTLSSVHLLFFFLKNIREWNQMCWIECDVANIYHLCLSRKMEVEQMFPPAFCFVFTEKWAGGGRIFQDPGEHRVPRCSSQSGCIHTKLKPGSFVLPNRNAMSGFVSESCHLLIRPAFCGCFSLSSYSKSWAIKMSLPFIVSLTRYR